MAVFGVVHKPCTYFESLVLGFFLKMMSIFQQQSDGVSQPNLSHFPPYLITPSLVLFEARIQFGMGVHEQIHGKHLVLSISLLYSVLLECNENIAHTMRCLARVGSLLPNHFLNLQPISYMRPQFSCPGKEAIVLETSW